MKSSGPQSEQDIINKFSNYRSKIFKTIGQEDKYGTLEEIFNRQKIKAISKKNQIKANFSLTVRYYSVFGLTFTALLFTRRIRPTIYAFGLSTAFI